MRRAIESPWMGVAGILGFLALWQVGSWLSDPFILPSPVQTLTALGRLASGGALWRAAMTTTANTLTGFAIAALIGGVLGLAAGLFRVVRRLAAPIVTVLQGIPQIAWIVLAMFWFGIRTDRPVIFAVAVATLPVIFAGVVEGVRTVDRSLLAMARTYKTPPVMLLADLYMPHLFSYLFPAAVSSLGIAWKVAVMSELMAGGSGRGIGVGLGTARTNFQVDTAMAWVLLVVLLMFVLEYVVLHPLRRRVERWRR